MKIEQLEGMRGIAAFIVFLNHFMLAFAPQRHGYIAGAIPGGNLMETPFFFMINGAASVTLFFVLSGFVLSYGTFQNSRKSVAGAVIRRWPRLVPVVLASCLLSYGLFKFGLFHYVEASELTRSDWMATFGYASQQLSPETSLFDAVSQGAFYIFFRSIKDSWFNSSLWTMHLELVGSFIVFGLAAIVRDSRPQEAAMVFVIAGLLVFFGNVYLPLFVAGTALAYFHSRRTRQTNSISKPVVVLTVALALLGLGYIEPATGFYKALGTLAPLELYSRVFIHGVASVALIQLALVDKSACRLLSLRPIRFLGRVSFPLYALHVPLILSFSAGAFVFLVPRLEYRGAVLTCFLATLCVLLPLSHVFAGLDHRWCAFLRGGQRPKIADAQTVARENFL